MKTILLTLVAILMTTSMSEVDPLNGMGSGKRTSESFPLQCPPYPALTGNPKQTAGNDTSSEPYDKSWYQQAMEQIEKEEYNISYNEELGAYQSPNRANNIRFIYHNDGFTAKTRDVGGEKSEWEVQLRLRNFESGIENSEIRAAGNKAWIENENIRIDYTNDKDGMRQDFIIKQKPAGEEKLRLDIEADTKLKMIVGADALMFKNEKGEEKMKYSALKVWDANGKELRAYFEKNNYEKRTKS